MESCSKAICLLGIGVLIIGGLVLSTTILSKGWLYGSAWLALLLKGEDTVGAASSLLWVGQTDEGQSRRGYSLLGRVWVVGSVIGAEGECEGRWLLKLLSVGFGDGASSSYSSMFVSRCG